MVESWHISATFLVSSSCIHPQKTRCVYLQGFLGFCSFLSLFPPFSAQVLWLPHAALQDASRGFSCLPQCSSWEHISCLQSRRSHTYLLCRFKEQDAEAGSHGDWKNQQSHRVWTVMLQCLLSCLLQRRESVSSSMSRLKVFPAPSHLQLPPLWTVFEFNKALPPLFNTLIAKQRADPFPLFSLIWKSI